jgi:hypothetical protein
MADIALSSVGSDPMAYLGDRRGAAVRQNWPFGDLPAPVVDGDSATYQEVLPGVDLIQRARPTGVMQVLKVKTREALTDPRVAGCGRGSDAEALSEPVLLDRRQLARCARGGSIDRVDEDPGCATGERPDRRTLDGGPIEISDHPASADLLVADAAGLEHGADTPLGCVRHAQLHFTGIPKPEPI